jgi:hypothetical protein
MIREEIAERRGQRGEDRDETAERGKEVTKAKESQKRANNHNTKGGRRGITGV